jgi:tRNA pseudouridine55 synthase
LTDIAHNGPALSGAAVAGPALSGSAIAGAASGPRLAGLSDRPLNGLLLIDKPQGPTSHDVVARIRKLANTKSCGHTGTLDPMATGLLLVLVGPATKLAAFMAESDKSYLAQIRLGLVTDTLDVTGKTLSVWPGPWPSIEEVRETLLALTGDSLQKPPSFSAIKVAGKAAHKLARSGKEPDLEPRPVTARELRLTEYAPPLATVRCEVSKGYYVRSLARDLGQALGLGGGALTSLRRLTAGPFGLDSAAPLPESPEELRRRLITPRRALAHLPELSLSEPEVKALSQGQRLAPPPAAAGTYKIIAPGGILAAIGQIVDPAQGPHGQPVPGTPEGPFLRPLRVFMTA